MQRGPILRGAAGLMVLFLMAGAAFASPWPHDPACDLPLSAQMKLPLPPGPPANPTLVMRVVAKAVGETNFFCSQINLPAGPVAAILNLSTRGPVEVFLNGSRVKEIPQQLEPRYAKSYEVGRYLHPGTNSVVIREQSGPDKIILLAAALQVLTSDGRITRLVSGSGWQMMSDDITDGGENGKRDNTRLLAVCDLAPLDKVVAGLAYWNEPVLPVDFLRVLRVHPVDIRLVADTTRFADLFKPLLESGMGTAHVSLPAGGLKGWRTNETPNIQKRLETLQRTSPGILVDFGRTISGRLVVRSQSSKPCLAVISFGESPGEALNAPAIGLQYLLLPPMGEGQAIDVGFRFARIHLVPATDESVDVELGEIGCDHVFYPAEYAGDFNCSDEKLNKIWRMSAYTARLNAQWAVLDANKRDRFPFTGDLMPQQASWFSAFGDPQPARCTLEWLAAHVATNQPGVVVARHINGISTYTSFWAEEIHRDYLETGDAAFVARVKPWLIGLLLYEIKDLDKSGLYANVNNGWPFIDWSPGLWQRPALTPVSDAQNRGAHFLLWGALNHAVALLKLTGDDKQAQVFQEVADNIQRAANQAWWDEAAGVFSDRQQINTLAVFTGFATPGQTRRLWQTSLSQPLTGTFSPDWRDRTRSAPDIMSPYFRFYWLEACGLTGHPRQGLDEIREVWGRMLDRGATTTWENLKDQATPSGVIPGYGPDWADIGSNSPNYGQSFCHGWSSSPASWLPRWVLGVRPVKPGYAEAVIEPFLGDLSRAEGRVPTPHGVIVVRHEKISGRWQSTVTVPAGVQAEFKPPAGTTDCEIAAGDQTSHQKGPQSVWLAPGKTIIRMRLDQ